MKRTESSVQVVAYELTENELRAAVDEWMTTHGGTVGPNAKLLPIVDHAGRVAGLRVQSTYSMPERETPIGGLKSPDLSPTAVQG